MATNDSVNNPKHYHSSDAKCDGCGKQITCIEVIRTLKCNLANAIKYAWRCEHKTDKTEDLKKAIWYLQDELKQCEPAIKRRSVRSLRNSK